MRGNPEQCNCITADTSKIRINSSMVPNFVMKVDHTM